MYAELGILFKLLIMCMKFFLLVLVRLIWISSLVRACVGSYMGVPCDHAVVCILRSNRHLHDFVDPGFLSKTYAASYDVGLYPIATMYKVASNSGIANVSCVLPPSTKRPPGRPKKLRIASRGEFKRQKRQMKCGRCGVLGSHNKKTCIAPVAFE